MRVAVLASRGLVASPITLVYFAFVPRIFGQKRERSHSISLLLPHVVFGIIHSRGFQTTFPEMNPHVPLRAVF